MVPGQERHDLELAPVSADDKTSDAVAAPAGKTFTDDGNNNSTAETDNATEDDMKCVKDWFKTDRKGYSGLVFVHGCGGAGLLGYAISVATRDISAGDQSGVITKAINWVISILLLLTALWDAFLAAKNGTQEKCYPFLGKE